MDDATGLKIGTAQESGAHKPVGEAPGLGVPTKEQALSPVLVGDVDVISVALRLEWRPFQQSLAVTQKSFSTGRRNRSIRVDSNFANAKRVSKQRIRVCNQAAEQEKWRKKNRADPQ
jgi:hypothetical protein